MWKLLGSLLSEELYKHLETKNLLLEEEKGCRLSLSPLLFIVASIPLTLVLMKMKAGSHREEGKRMTAKTPRAISQSHHYGHVHGVRHQQMRNPNYEKGIKLPAIGKIRSLDETTDDYKYLGIIEADDRSDE